MSELGGGSPPPRPTSGRDDGTPQYVVMYRPAPWARPGITFVAKTDSRMPLVLRAYEMTTERATCWSLTINNPTSADDEEINLARQRGWTVDGQPEIGAEGTPHYQLILRTPQVRFAAVKKAFSRAHIEIARNPAALQQYVRKEDTRAGQLSEQSAMYPSLSRFWELLYDHFNEDEAFDYTLLPDEVRFYDLDTHRAFRKDPLTFFDDAVRALISRGYHVETLAMNPSTRASFTKYWDALFVRVARKRVQDEQIVDVPVYTNADESHEEEGCGSPSSPHAPAPCDGSP